MKLKLSFVLVILTLILVSCNESSEEEYDKYYFNVSFNGMEYRIRDSELLTLELFQNTYSTPTLEKENLIRTYVHTTLRDNYIFENDSYKKINPNEPTSLVFFIFSFEYDPSLYSWGTKELLEHLKADVFPEIKIKSVNNRNTGVKFHYERNGVLGMEDRVNIFTSGSLSRWAEGGYWTWAWGEMPESEIKITEVQEVSKDTIRLSGDFNLRMYSNSGNDTIRALGKFAIPMLFKE